VIRTSITSAGVGHGEPLQQFRQIAAHDMVTDGHDDDALLDLEGVERILMGTQQGSRGIEEQCPVGGQPHEARRPLEQAPSKGALEALDACTHRCLCRPERLGGPREVAQVGDQHEGLHRHDVERRWNLVI
jgi:hypothetical protein